jgi:hypothetical protein
MTMAGAAVDRVDQLGDQRRFAAKSSAPRLLPPPMRESAMSALSQTAVA